MAVAGGAKMPKVPKVKESDLPANAPLHRIIQLAQAVRPRQIDGVTR